MLRTVTSSICRVAKSAAITRSAPVTLQTANMGTAQKKGSVMDAWNKSCYHEMDYTISEDATVYDAVQKFSAYDVGALVTVDAAGKTFLFFVSKAVVENAAVRSASRYNEDCHSTIPCAPRGRTSNPKPWLCFQGANQTINPKRTVL